MSNLSSVLNLKGSISHGLGTQTLEPVSWFRQISQTTYQLCSVFVLQFLQFSLGITKSNYSIKVKYVLQEKHLEYLTLTKHSINGSFYYLKQKIFRNCKCPIHYIFKISHLIHFNDQSHYFLTTSKSQPFPYGVCSWQRIPCLYHFLFLCLFSFIIFPYVYTHILLVASSSFLNSIF